MKLQLPPIVKELDAVLVGYPNYILSGGLVILGIFAILVGIYGRPTFKGVLFAWFVAP